MQIKVVLQNDNGEVELQCQRVLTGEDGRLRLYALYEGEMQLCCEFAVAAWAYWSIVMPEADDSATDEERTTRTEVLLPYDNLQEATE